MVHLSVFQCRRLSGFGPVLEGAILYHFISFYPILYYMKRVVLSLGCLSLRKKLSHCCSRGNSGFTSLTNANVKLHFILIFFNIAV